MNFVYGSASVVHTPIGGGRLRGNRELGDLFPSFLRRASRLSSLPHIRSECSRSRLPLFLPEVLSFNSVFPTFMQEGFPLGDFFHPTSFPFLHLLHAVLYYVDTFSPFQFLPPLPAGNACGYGMEMDSPSLGSQFALSSSFSRANRKQKQRRRKQQQQKLPLSPADRGSGFANRRGSKRI